MQKLDLGQAVLKPRKSLVAGSYATISWVYTAGHPIDDSGYVKIAFRQVGDFAAPQFDRPDAPNYCSVRTTGDCRIVPRWDNKGHTRPWSKALYLQVRFGYLDRGEKITVTFGDTNEGSPGWRVQSFCEHTFEFKTLVDPIATYVFEELPESPTVRIVPGEPKRAVCVAPSQAVTGEPFAYHLKLEDKWGNPVAKPRKLKHRGFAEPGTRLLHVRDPKTKRTVHSNPVTAEAKPPAMKRYWADLHGQSEETIGSNSIDDYYAFARDYGLVDVAAHQGNDFQVTDAFWHKVNETSKAFYEPGRFVTFPGYEWSANTPLGGDRNVYYKSEGGRIARSGCHLLPGRKSRYEDAPTAKDLFRMLKGPGPFVFAHAGGRYADIRTHDPKREVAVEVHSAWGTFEWLVEDALRLGYRIGICANSDGHKCRPGASYPGAGEFGSLGGLTCILAERLDRDSIHEAIMARHFYATTGNRPLLDVNVTTPDGVQAMMGDVLKVGKAEAILRVRAIGAAPIESVEVRNGLDSVRTRRPYKEEDLGRRIKVVWSGAEVRGRNRMVRWDGWLAVKGNAIRRHTPINFWNPARPMVRESAHRLSWRSVTTGGVAGVILELEKANAGRLDIETGQKHMSCEIESIGLTPRSSRLGGVGKCLEVYRLPDRRGIGRFSFDLPLKKMRKGDNPIYVCVRQEDGHMAWSSPIYVIG